MISNPSPKSATNIKLPISFIVYALFAFSCSQIILFMNSSDMLIGQFRLPDIWMGAHFLLLGFAVMVAMGAMYQLVPVAFLTPIWNERFGFIQFGITALGVGFFSTLLSFKPSVAIYGGMLAVIGVVMFIIQMVITILSQQKKSLMTITVLVAIISLFLTIVAGLLLAWNIAYGGIINHTSILYSHIALGIAGWFTLLIFGFSYKLVPMFSLSHGFSMKWAKPMVITYITGLIMLLLSFWIQVTFLPTIGWFLLCLGFTFFVLDVKEIIKKRMKKKLDKPFIFSLFAIGNGLVIHFIALVGSLYHIKSSIFWGWLIFLYIFSWVIFSILGYLYKIVPFLWWTHKYADRIGKEKVPTLKEMIHEKASINILTLFIIGIVGLVLFVILQVGIGVFVFQGILAVASILYAISIIRVLFI
ncbi:hypothetical protein [Paucisalibacillus globulus]|uniref:hypothetical protein n=1 Tax=Paucisalibacillus globulus TaxID=351095 RepID=UPI00047BBF0E|nr:hypothetical protein [Paucisalibacillus globulus]